MKLINLNNKSMNKLDFVDPSGPQPGPTSLKLYKASLKSSSHDNIIFYDEICIGWLSGSSGTL